MIRFLLNVLLAFLALRFLVGIGRNLGGGGQSRHLGDDSRDRVDRPRDGGGRARAGAQFDRADRASAIDVPFTEVEPGESGPVDTGKAESSEGRP